MNMQHVVQVHSQWLYQLNPLTPTTAIMVTAIKHPAPDRIKPSFVIFDIWALWRLSAERQTLRA